MAITRAQQARQMLKDGNFVMQGGVKNYLGEQETVSNVPIKWQSGPDKPATELAYITEAEKKLLLKEDIHGSLKDGPNEGPKGIISLDSAGDRDGPVGGFSGEDVSAAERGEKVAGMSTSQERGFRAGAISAGAGLRDTDDLETIQQANQIAKNVRDRYSKQENLTFGEKVNLYNIGTKQKALDRYINQRKNEILSGLDQLNLNPAYDDEEETFEDLISGAKSITEFSDKFSQKTIDDVLAGKRQIDFFSEIDPNLAPGLGPKALVGLANLIGPKLAGPVTKEKLESLLSEINTLESIDPKDTTTKDLMREFAPNQYRTAYPEEFPDGNGDQQPILPIMSQASAPVSAVDDYYGPGGNPFLNRTAYRLLAEGGFLDDEDYVGGGIMDASGRQQYFLGKLVKSAKKAVKGVTRAVKKVAKSPIGKAALFAGLGAYAGGFGPFAAGGKFSGLAGAGFLNPGNTSLMNILFKEGTIGSGLTGKGMLALGGALTAAPLIFGTGEDEEEETQTLDRGQGLNIAELRGAPFRFLAPRFTGSRFQFAADGGRIGYQEGSKEPVAKKTMPLLDMGGKEMDLREEGGFVPIGRMEKADDVPARLSKNEFVFTADAVRNAGDGNVDKGAEVMYNMMKNLEAGGDVSEESQGLEGARKMFQTSQRLEEVL